MLVFDEADNMLDQRGFADDSFRVVREVMKGSQQVQLLLFSATYNERIKKFSMQITGNKANHVIY